MANYGDFLKGQSSNYKSFIKLQANNTKPGDARYNNRNPTNNPSYDGSGIMGGQTHDSKFGFGYNPDRMIGRTGNRTRGGGLQDAAARRLDQKKKDLAKAQTQKRMY